MAAVAAGSAGLPTKRAQRYDRQLRLWGDQGQDALYRASICCIGSSAVSCEILKNLVLPGIGSFTIIDKAVVCVEDCGSNFFVTAEDIGKPRAQCATELLKEMNSEVKGDWVEEDPRAMLNTRPDFFKEFTVVIATGVSEDVVSELSELLWTANIPLIVAKAYGMLGYIRLAMREHCIVESHTSDTVGADDLRLLRPFPELINYCSGFDLGMMSNSEYRHTPYAVILYRFLEQWKSEHGGAAPATYKEKVAFRNALQDSVRTDSTTGIPMSAENFDEASKAVNTALMPDEIPRNIKELTSRVEATSLNDKSDKFWILVNALGAFIDTNGTLPIRGAIPDMTSDSDTYVKLQMIYRKKAQDDAAAIASISTDSLESLGIPLDTISDLDVKTFCKNASSIQVLATRSICEEWSPDTCKKSDIEQLLETPDSDIHWYLLLRAADRFKTLHGHFPGQYDNQVDEDIPRLKEVSGAILEELQISTPVKDECIAEMCRFGGSELHNIAAFTGGAAAHEVVKLITHQYVPFNNTYIFNGMTGGATTVEL